MGYNSNIQRDDWECDEMFTNENLKRLILPLVVEQILAVTIGMSDTIMVSSVGEAAVSGLSLVDTINILLINIFAALATGGAVVCSQYLGGRDRDRACVSAKQLIVSTGIFAVIIMGIVLIGCTAILQLVFTDVEPAVMWNAEIYFKISAWSYPFIALYNSGAALFRSMGNSKISMITSLFMNAFNILGNAVLIYGFHMGVAGAAISSLVSRILGSLFMLYLLRSPDNLIYIDSYRKLEFHPDMIRRILTIGIPNGLENGMFQIGTDCGLWYGCDSGQCRSEQYCTNGNHTRCRNRTCNDNGRRAVRWGWGLCAGPSLHKKTNENRIYIHACGKSYHPVSCAFASEHI